MPGEPEVPNAQSIFLWPGEAPAQGASDFRPWLDPYLLPTDGTARPAVMICPGGGYGGRAQHEGIDIARAFNKEGFHAFVCHYRVTPNFHPAPLWDAARCIRIIRARAAEWGVDAERVAVCGFSAGGHLAGSLGTLYEQSAPTEPDAIDAITARPDALILCYAVLTWGPHAHQGSFRNLLGPDAQESDREQLSLERWVNAQTPPTFLWSTAEDKGVPVQNSLIFATALRQAGVDFALHVFPKGSHGLGLAPAYPDVSRWHDLCSEWLRLTFA